MQLGDRLLRAFIGRHLDEAEAARAARGHVAHHCHRFDRTDPLEQLLKILLRRAVGRFPLQLPTHRLLLVTLKADETGLPEDCR